MHDPLARLVRRRRATGSPSPMSRGKPRAIWKVRTSPTRAIAVGPPAGDVVAVEDDAPRSGGISAGDAVEQRRLAGAVRADQAGDACPARRSRSAPSSAVTPPKCLESPLTSSKAMRGRDYGGCGTRSRARNVRLRGTTQSRPDGNTGEDGASHRILRLRSQRGSRRSALTAAQDEEFLCIAGNKTRRRGAAGDRPRVAGRARTDRSQHHRQIADAYRRITDALPTDPRLGAATISI